MLKSIHRLLLFLSFLYSSFALAAYSGGTAEVEINGLVCDFCARSIEKVFIHDPAVESVKVDMSKRLVRIHFKPKKMLKEQEIKTKITSSGYDVVAIKYVEPEED